MKKIIKNVLPVMCIVIISCNDSAEADPVEKADSINESRLERAEDSGAAATAAVAQVDETTADFFVKAADLGMAEVAAANVAQTKAVNKAVKDFAGMMINDHTGANTGLKELAGKKTIKLPDSVSADNQKAVNKLQERSAKEFDKAYMDLQVSDHKKAVDLFEKASKDVQDADVKTFVDNTLPKLKGHLEAAKSIQSKL